MISITYYTDPLCCWSWAMQPVLHKLRAAFGDAISIRYCMGGLIPSWENFSDPVNSVSRPIQMGPVWMHASQVAGVSMDTTLWFHDPPASSYPACIAFKCVQLQSEEYADLYLCLLRQSAMINGINISKQEELVKLAHELKEYYSAFDVKLFLADLVNGKGREAFRTDMEEVKSANISRFPSMILRKPDKPGLLIIGYRPYNDLLEVILRLRA